MDVVRYDGTDEFQNVRMISAELWQGCFVPWMYTPEVRVPGWFHPTVCFGFENHGPNEKIVLDEDILIATLLKGRVFDLESFLTGPKDDASPADLGDNVISFILMKYGELEINWDATAKDLGITLRIGNRVSSGCLPSDVARQFFIRSRAEAIQGS